MFNAHDDWLVCQVLFNLKKNSIIRLRYKKNWRNTFLVQRSGISCAIDLGTYYLFTCIK